MIAIFFSNKCAPLKISSLCLFIYCLMLFSQPRALLCSSVCFTDWTSNCSPSLTRFAAVFIGRELTTAFLLGRWQKPERAAFWLLLETPSSSVGGRKSYTPLAPHCFLPRWLLGGLISTSLPCGFHLLLRCCSC